MIKIMDESETKGDTANFDPNHPVFAPMQEALMERFRRKNKELREAIRYLHVDCMHSYPSK